MNTHTKSAAFITLTLLLSLSACGIPDMHRGSAVLPTTQGAYPLGPTDMSLPEDPTAFSLQQTKQAEDQPAQVGKDLEATQTWSSYDQQFLTPAWYRQQSFRTELAVTYTALALRRTIVAQTGTPARDPNALPVTLTAGGGELSDYTQPPFHSTVFLGINQWFIRVEEQDISVYAGYESRENNTDNPLQGMLIVQVTNADFTPEGPNPTSTNFYRTPSRSGAVRIVDAQAQGMNMQLTVETSGGERYRFDVMNGIFTPLER